MCVVPLIRGELRKHPYVFSESLKWLNTHQQYTKT